MFMGEEKVDTGIEIQSKDLYLSSGISSLRDYDIDNNKNLVDKIKNKTFSNMVNNYQNLADNFQEEIADNLDVG